MANDAQNTTEVVVKRVVGRPFVKGQVTNPGGRPRGLASYIREITRDGKDLADFVKAIYLGDRTVTNGQRITPELQLEAAKLLIERGYGKAVSPIEITGLDGGPIQMLDLTVLATTDLEQLESILARGAMASKTDESTGANTADNTDTPDS